MISVSISINANAIYTRTAIRIKDPTSDRPNAIYKVDDGNYIQHNPDDGAIKLAKKLLDLVEESK